MSYILYDFLNIFIGLFIIGINGVYLMEIFFPDFMSTELFNEKNFLHKLFYTNIPSIFTQSK